MSGDDTSGRRETASRRLTPEERQALLHLARRALEAHLTGAGPVAAPAEPEGLVRPRAAFVTLRRADSGELRGCRGEVVARRPLAESVIRGAIAAATDDPRFLPVTPQELPGLRIEINALTAPQAIAPEEVEVGRHGLLLLAGQRSGLLLPEVPLEWGWDREEFLANLCLKAGLPTDAWTWPEAQLFGFEAEVWGEEK